MPVVVEVFALRPGAGDGLAYRRTSAALRDGETPDDAVSRLCDFARAERRDVLVHSTSWRCGRTSEITLTYVVAPDPRLAETTAVPLDELEIAGGTEPGHPAPERIDEHHVVSHAIRHLAFVCHTDPVARKAAADLPWLAERLATTTWSMAGQLVGSSPRSSAFHGSSSFEAAFAGD